MKKILIAATPESAEIVTSALAPHFRIAVCESLSEAKLLVDQKPDLVICSLYFDGGHMIELLRYVKTKTLESPTKNLPIPFLFVKTTRDSLNADIQQGLKSASLAVGAKEFINFVDWVEKLGDTIAQQKLRSVIWKHVRLASIRKHTMFHEKFGAASH
jgi:CheY-like chemotaxis protein